MSQQKQTMWAVVGTADDDGLVADLYPKMTPFITMVEGRTEWLLRKAQEVSDATGRSVELVRFERAEVIRVITPRPQG